MIRNISRVTDIIDDFWHKCMNSALDNHGPTSEGGVKEERLFGNEERELVTEKRMGERPPKMHGK